MLPRHASRTSLRRPVWLAVAIMLLTAGFFASPAWADQTYVSQPLNFSTKGQSMWGAGNAFQKSDSIFVGPSWNDGFTWGGIIGKEHDWCVLVECDTRTGVELSVHSSGDLGLKFGYSIDSGSVDATADFKPTATAPEQVAANSFFNIGTQSALSGGTIDTQSPEVSAYMNAVMQLSGSISGEGCIIFAGCSSSTSSLPNIDLDQTILSIDPNAINVLPGIRPDGKPLAQLPLAGGSLTLSDGLGAPGFEISDDHGTTLFTTVPEGVPTNDLGELGFNVPNVATHGDWSGSGSTIASSGSDGLLSASLDVDGLLTAAIEAATGVPVPFGADWELDGVGSLHVDLADIDIGPYLDFTQGFEFDPELYVDLAFDHPVNVMGQGWLSSWVGPWDALPAFALSQTTTFTPTFFLDAAFTNNTGMLLGLEGTWEILKLSGSLGPLTIPDTSLNQLLGWGDTMFDVQTQPWNIYNNSFQLGGFSRILANSFTISVGQGPVIGPPGGGGDVSVPEPGDLWMLLFGLCVLAGCRRFGLRAGKDGG